MKIPEKYTKKMPPFDALAHFFHDTCMTANYPFKKTGLLCIICRHPLTYAYHEERLYSVHCKTCDTITLTTAADPGMAAKIAGGITDEEATPNT